jgi:cytochrome c-type biogenesis protein CcmH/NrfG
MANEAVEQKSTAAPWSSAQVYTMAILCLVIGLAIGYLFRGSQSPAKTNPVAASTASPAGMKQMPSLEQMKHMADTKAQPLLEKLKTDPNNSDLLFQIGNIYKATHQFKAALGYYDQAAKADPKNIAIRTELASCMYYNGDVEGALSQLQQSLRQNPKDANSLFNLGMIRWQGKRDAKGALSAWQELLKTNPQLSADRKATVQRLIADVKQQNQPSQLQDVTR